MQQLHKERRSSIGTWLKQSIKPALQLINGSRKIGFIEKLGFSIITAIQCLSERTPQWKALGEIFSSDLEALRFLIHVHFNFII